MTGPRTTGPRGTAPDTGHGRHTPRPHGNAPDAATGPRGRHAAVFRALLRLYPRTFRDVYAGEMTEYFVQRLDRARGEGRRAELRYWLRSVADIAATAAAERCATRRRHRPPRRESDMMSALTTDLRHAVRRLRRSPLFTACAIAILALGIGLNAAVFGLVDAMLFRPPPFAEPERVVHVYQDSDAGDPNSTSFPAFRDMTAFDDVFEAVGATSSGGVLWESNAGPEQFAVEYATSGYFAALGLRPSRGRWLTPAHDVVGADMVAVLTHSAWRTKFGGDPGVIGRAIRLNNQAVTIIGVGPPNFNGDAGALLSDAWLSISSTPVSGSFRVSNLDRREDHWYQVKARLAPGVGIERARAAMDGLAHRLAADFPELNEGRGITVFAHDELRFHPEVDGALLPVGIGLLTVAGLVLLLACTSLANLLLVRGLARGSEVAVRRALGAGRAQVVRLLLLESLILATLGAAVGLVLAAFALRLTPGLPLPIPGRGIDVGIDLRVALFAALLAVVTACLSGLLPALRSAHGDVAASLRDEGRGRTAGRGVSLMRAGLVAVQVAVSVVLVVGAGLLARSLGNAARVDPGVDTDRIAVLGTNFGQAGIPPAGNAAVVAQILERFGALPGVDRVAITTRLPLQGGGTTTQVVDGYEPRTGAGSVELPFAYVSRDYFETMGMHIVDGRGFAIDDRPESPRVVIVNETAARQFWNGDVRGGRIRGQNAETWLEVVGVVSDTKVNSLSEQPAPLIFYAAEQGGVGVFSVVARTAGPPAALLTPMRTALRDVRASLPVTRLAPLATLFGDTLAVPRLAAALLAAFSLLALVLAGLGVYAVVSFNVQRRTRELGIRAALGAARSRLVLAVVAESVAAVALGITAGLWFATIAARSIEGMLFGVGTFDAGTFASAAALLLAAAVIAAAVPALRAARTDPVTALRTS